MTSPQLDAAVLLAAYDATRDALPSGLPPDCVIDRDGPLLRLAKLVPHGYLGYRDLGGLHGDAVDVLIGRQRDYFAARGEPVEWKLHGHDLPADLPARLTAAGFEAQERETVVAGLAASLAAVAPDPPVGVRIIEVRTREDFERIEAMENAVWGDQRYHLAGMLSDEVTVEPDSIAIFVAEADDDTAGGVVSAAWIRMDGRSEFATLWGGATLPAWRGRGVYRALVAARAELAVARGYRYLQVDASDDSRPILQRLGMIALTTTTPYIFRPSTSAPAGR